MKLKIRRQILRRCRGTITAGSGQAAAALEGSEKSAPVFSEKIKKLVFCSFSVIGIMQPVQYFKMFCLNFKSKGDILKNNISRFPKAADILRRKRGVQGSGKREINLRKEIIC